MEQLISYIGLDVHKETIAVAVVEAGQRSEVREYGKIANTPAAVKLSCLGAGARRPLVPEIGAPLGFRIPPHTLWDWYDAVRALSRYCVLGTLNKREWAFLRCQLPA